MTTSIDRPTLAEPLTAPLAAPLAPSVAEPPVDDRRQHDERSERVVALLRAARQQVEGAVAVLRVAEDLRVDTRELHERTRVLCADARRRIMEAREILSAGDVPCGEAGDGGAQQGEVQGVPVAAERQPRPGGAPTLH